MTGPAGRSAALLLTALAPLSILATRWVAGGDLPDPLPTHWDLSGRVDGTLPASGLLTVTLLVSTLLAGGAAALLARRTVTAAERVTAAGLAWAAWLAALVHDVPVLLSIGATRAADVSLPWWAVLALPAVPTLVAAAVLALVRPAPQETAGAGGRPSTLHLDAGERAAWVGASSSRFTLTIAAALLLAASVAAWSAWQPAAVLGIAGVVVLWVHAITVRVDERGLSVAWGPLHWPHSRVALADITNVSVEQIEPVRWGGWGYRVIPGASAAVARRGPGIVVERRSGRRFAVTVDRPEPGVELLRALLERQAREPD